MADSAAATSTMRDRPELLCPRCRGESLGGDLSCPACGAEFPSMTVDNGSPVPVLLEDEDAAVGMTAAERILERLDEGPPWPDGPTHAAERHFLDALSVYGGAHWGAYASPAIAVPDLHWIAAALERAEPTPPGPAIVLGAAAAGEAMLVPGDRRVVALDGSVPLLGLASGLSVDDQWLPLSVSPGQYRLRRLELPGEVRQRLRRIDLVCADALNPPFRDASFAVALCLNVVDSITRPAQLLRRCRSLLTPGGVLLLSTAYNWDDDVTPYELRIAGPPEGFDVIWSAPDIPWRLRIHDRLTSTFRLEAMLLRKRDDDGRG